MSYIEHKKNTSNTETYTQLHAMRQARTHARTHARTIKTEIIIVKAAPRTEFG